MRKLTLILAIAATTLPFTSQAQERLAAEYFAARTSSAAVPSVLSDTERAHYRILFAAIRREDWAEVESLLAQRQGILDPVARAEYYLHANSPRVEADAIISWMSQGRRLPHAQRLENLAQTRGYSGTFGLPRESRLEPRGYAPKRILPRDTADGTIPSSIASAILDRISNDDPDGARQLLDGVDGGLSSEARTEWRRRVAWSYYIENRDAEALAMAQLAKTGSGAWLPEAYWVSGIAAWRLNDCVQAAEDFENAGRYAANPELSAAGYYWAARANTRCRMPQKVAELLRGASRLDETLYGMLALEQLGREQPDRFGRVDFDRDDWNRIGGNSNVQMAVALSEIGEEDLAGEVLRHEAAIGDDGDYNRISRLARALGLPGTQLFLAHRAPRGESPSAAARYPVARWQPINGWKVDPALAYAHALQESNFQRSVTSPAGAQGLMQIMPIAAREYAGSIGLSSSSDLSDPGINLAFGQRALQALSQSSSTQGKLPKIMAAYNAGLTPVGRWEYEVRDQDDPLLYMESIPYWETRGYVAIVTRNYWMYERQANARSPTREQLAANAWPLFPGLRQNSDGRVYLDANYAD